MSYFVYIIQSLKDNSFYIGSTNDLERRLSEHNQGLSKYTSAKMPWELVYTESFDDVTIARKREYFLKKQRNRVFYQKLIDSVG
jgi:putative endonuclease